MTGPDDGVLRTCTICREPVLWSRQALDAGSPPVCKACFSRTYTISGEPDPAAEPGPGNPERVALLEAQRTAGGAAGEGEPWKALNDDLARDGALGALGPGETPSPVRLELEANRQRIASLQEQVGDLVDRARTLEAELDAARSFREAEIQHAGRLAARILELEAELEKCVELENAQRRVADRERDRVDEIIRSLGRGRR